MNTYLRVALLTFFLVIFGFNKVYAQSYIKNFKADICECLEAKKSTTTTIDGDYSKCFKTNLVTYAPLIDASINIEDKNLKYIEGQKIRGSLGFKFKYELMYSCDTYFYAYERGIYASKEKQKQHGDSVKLQKMNELVAMKPHWNSYVLRAKEYYNLNDLRKAEQDILKSIELSPFANNVVQLRAQRLFLSQIYEDQKRYDEAIKLYDGIILGDIDYQTQILKAIVVRKKNGNYYSPKANDAERNTSNNQIKKTNAQSKNEINTTPNNSSRRRSSGNNRTQKKDSTKTKTSQPVTEESTKKKELRSLFKLD